MLYGIAQEAAIGAVCIKAMAYLVIIGVFLAIGVLLVKNLKPLT